MFWNDVNTVFCVWNTVIEFCYAHAVTTMWFCQLIIWNCWVKRSGLWSDRNIFISDNCRRMYERTIRYRCLSLCCGVAMFIIVWMINKWAQAHHKPIDSHSFDFIANQARNLAMCFAKIKSLLLLIESINLIRSAFALKFNTFLFIFPTLYISHKSNVNNNKIRDSHKSMDVWQPTTTTTTKQKKDVNVGMSWCQIDAFDWKERRNASSHLLCCWW